MMRWDGLLAPYPSKQNFSCPVVALFSSTSLLSMKNLGSKNTLILRLTSEVGIGKRWLIDVFA